MGGKEPYETVTTADKESDETVTMSRADTIRRTEGGSHDVQRYTMLAGRMNSVHKRRSGP